MPQSQSRKAATFWNMVVAMLHFPDSRFLGEKLCVPVVLILYIYIYIIYTKITIYLL